MIAVHMVKQSKNSARRILARNVRALRLERGLSQHELAAEASTRQALVSEIEVGSANPTLDTLERLAQALKVSFAELFDASQEHRA